MSNNSTPDPTDDFTPELSTSLRELARAALAAHETRRQAMRQELSALLAPAFTPRRPAIFISLVDEDYVWYRTADDHTPRFLPVLSFIQQFGEHRLLTVPGMLVAPTVGVC